MTLRGLALMLQAMLGDGLAFDPYSLQEDFLAAVSKRRLGLDWILSW
jgi:hypothetical protein